MKIMQYEPVNEHRHPWREAIKTQVPTLVVAVLITIAYVVGVWVGGNERSCYYFYPHSFQGFR